MSNIEIARSSVLCPLFPDRHIPAFAYSTFKVEIAYFMSDSEFQWKPPVWGLALGSFLLSAGGWSLSQVETPCDQDQDKQVPQGHHEDRQEPAAPPRHPGDVRCSAAGQAACIPLCPGNCEWTFSQLGPAHGYLKLEGGLLAHNQVMDWRALS